MLKDTVKSALVSLSADSRELLLCSRHAQVPPGHHMAVHDLIPPVTQFHHFALHLS